MRAFSVNPGLSLRRLLKFAIFLAFINVANCFAQECQNYNIISGGPTYNFSKKFYLDGVGSKERKFILIDYTARWGTFVIFSGREDSTGRLIAATESLQYNGLNLATFKSSPTVNQLKVNHGEDFFRAAQVGIEIAFTTLGKTTTNDWQYPLTSLYIYVINLGNEWYFTPCR